MQQEQLSKEQEQLIHQVFTSKETVDPGNLFEHRDRVDIANGFDSVLDLEVLNANLPKDVKVVFDDMGSCVNVINKLKEEFQEFITSESSSSFRRVLKVGTHFTALSIIKGGDGLCKAYYRDSDKTKADENLRPENIRNALHDVMQELYWVNMSSDDSDDNPNQEPNRCADNALAFVNISDAGFLNCSKENFLTESSFTNMLTSLKGNEGKTARNRILLKFLNQPQESTLYYSLNLDSAVNQYYSNRVNKEKIKVALILLLENMGFYNGQEGLSRSEIANLRDDSEGDFVRKIIGFLRNKDLDSTLLNKVQDSLLEYNGLNANKTRADRLRRSEIDGNQNLASKNKKNRSDKNKISWGNFWKFAFFSDKYSPNKDDIRSSFNIVFKGSISTEQTLGYILVDLFLIAFIALGVIFGFASIGAIITAVCLGLSFIYLVSQEIKGKGKRAGSSFIINFKKNYLPNFFKSLCKPLVFLVRSIVRLVASIIARLVSGYKSFNSSSDYNNFINNNVNYIITALTIALGVVLFLPELTLGVELAIAVTITLAYLSILNLSVETKNGFKIFSAIGLFVAGYVAFNSQLLVASVFGANISILGIAIAVVGLVNLGFAFVKAKDNSKIFKSFRDLLKKIFIPASMKNNADNFSKVMFSLFALGIPCGLLIYFIMPGAISLEILAILLVSMGVGLLLHGLNLTDNDIKINYLLVFGITVIVVSSFFAASFATGIGLTLLALLNIGYLFSKSESPDKKSLLVIPFFATATTLGVVSVMSTVSAYAVAAIVLSVISAILYLVFAMQKESPSSVQLILSTLSLLLVAIIPGLLLAGIVVSFELSIIIIAVTSILPITLITNIGQPLGASSLTSRSSGLTSDRVVSDLPPQTSVSRSAEPDLSTTVSSEPPLGQG